MKKLLAMVLCVVMLLSTCAMAEGYGVTLKNIAAYAGDAVLLDLSGIDIGVDFYSEGEGGGLQLSVGAMDQDVLSVVIAGMNEQLLLTMTGVSDVYSVDQQVISDGVAAAAPSLAVNDVSEVISAEDQAALLALLGKAVTLATTSVTPAGSEEIEGVTYEVITIEISAEAIQPLLEELVAIMDNYSHMLEGSGVSSFSEIYASLAPTLSVGGAVYNSETTGAADITLSGTVMQGAQSGLLNIYFEGAQGATEEEFSLYVELTVQAGEEAYTLAFELAGEGSDGSWLPAADAETVDLIAALEDETQIQKLATEAMSSGMMALSYMAAANETVAALLNSLMSSMMQG